MQFYCFGGYLNFSSVVHRIEISDFPIQVTAENTKQNLQRELREEGGCILNYIQKQMISFSSFICTEVRIICF